ncbi:MAG: hypothetical protein ACKOWF_16485 [Chloroflexota bacterium]
MTITRRAAVHALAGAAAASSASSAALAGSPAAEGERYPRRISWSGYSWAVKDSGNSAVGPGGNRFSASARNVWVDGGGLLRLRIERRGAFWRCAEVVAEPAGGFGYGTWEWTLASPVRGISPHAILGLFTWDATSNAQANREIDVEIGRWPESPDWPNASFTLQPYQQRGNIHPFPIPGAARPVTVGFTWSAGQVVYRAARGPALVPADPALVIETWTRAVAAVPTPGKEQPRINLWLPDALPPVRGKPVEVALSAFRFTPLA